MALSLLEASKTIEDKRTRAMTEIYATTYQPLQVMPLLTRPDGRMYWNVDGELPDFGSRAINSDFSPAEGSIEPWVSITKAYGGKIQVDKKIVREMPAAVQEQRMLQIKAYARKATVDLFTGAGGNDWKGLRAWAQGDYSGQNLTMGATGGGILPTPAKLLDLTDSVNVIPGRTFIYMNTLNFRYLSALSWAGNGATNQAIRYSQGELGNTIATFNGIPIIVLRDGKGVDLLPTNETDVANTGGTAGSIYCVTWGEDLVTGFWSMPPLVTAESDNTNFDTIRMELFMGMAPKIPRAFARLNNVKNAIS